MGENSLCSSAALYQHRRLLFFGGRFPSVAPVLLQASRIRQSPPQPVRSPVLKIPRARRIPDRSNGKMSPSSVSHPIERPLSPVTSTHRDLGSRFPDKASHPCRIAQRLPSPYPLR